MGVRAVTDDDLDEVARLVARLQQHGEHHVAYLGDDAEAIAAEVVDGSDDWAAAGAVAVDADRIVGGLVGSVDPDMGRVWWLGPFVDADLDTPDGAQRWREFADRLDETARHGLAATVAEEEWAFDERHAVGLAWAASCGGSIETGSAVLGLGDRIDGPAVPVRPSDERDAAAVSALHDLLFPGTHTPGSALVAELTPGRALLVIDDPVSADAGPVGYVAVERQPDGGGYIDYVGVAPAARRRGLGAELIRAGVAALASLGCTRVDLTVRADNDAARALYAQLGFVEERVIVPVRRGFSLG